MFGVNEFDFLLSVCGNTNFIEFISNAKSGQFFFYSSDGKYMVKTMTNVESKFLRRILPHYFRHCSQNPNTMMTKFLGMYRVKLYHLRRNVKFIIMNSVYYTDKVLQSFYDLKGSVTGRDSKPGQDVKKDNDLRQGLPESSLALPPDVRSRITLCLLVFTTSPRKRGFPQSEVSETLASDSERNEGTAEALYGM
jgi:Phosphatidylinositol-4-phosphate 5-Kinase